MRYSLLFISLLLCSLSSCSKIKSAGQRTASALGDVTSGTTGLIKKPFSRKEKAEDASLSAEAVPAYQQHDQKKFNTPSHSTQIGLIDGIAATVNGKVITHTELQEMHRLRIQLAAREMTTTELSKKISSLRKEALWDLIDRELLLGEFEKLGGSVKGKLIDEDIKKIIRQRYQGDRQKFINELNKSGLTLKKFRDLRQKMLVVQSFKALKTKKSAPPTPNEISEYYRKNKSLYSDVSYIKLSTLTIPKETKDPSITKERQKALIQDIRKKIISGDSFATLARTYSSDSKANEGGDRGWIGKDSLNKYLTKFAFALKAGTLSEIIEDNLNFYLLFCEARRDGAAKPLKEVQDDVYKRVLAGKRKQSYDRYIAQLRRTADVKIH